MKRYLQFIIAAISSVLFTSPIFSQEILVKDINTNPAEFLGYEQAELFCECGDYLFFAVPGKELWRTDGTPEGTISLGDLRKGVSQGFAGNMSCAGSKTLFFVASDGDHGRELWTSDGTEAGTKMVKDVTPGIDGNFNPLGSIGNTYYFATDSDKDDNLELWKSDGTESTTVMIPGFPIFTFVRSVATSDTHLFFRATDAVTRKIDLWATDGTGSNTVRIMEGYDPGSYTKSLGTNLMVGINILADHTHSLWSSDGTSSGTYKVMDFGARVQGLHRFNNKLIFDVSSYTWISDGTPAGTTQLTTGSTNASATIGNEFYGVGYDFSTGFHRVYKTNGNLVKVFNMSDADLGSIIQLRQIPVLRDSLYLQYFDESVGKEAAIFSANSETFHLLKDIWPGVNGSSPAAWAKLHDKIFFLADDGTHGAQVWSTDGSAEGTSMLKHILAGTDDTFRNFTYVPNELVVNEDKLQFVGESQLGNIAIYVSDGTEIGTTSKFEIDLPILNGIGQVNNNVIYVGNGKFYSSNPAGDVILLKDFGSTNYTYTLMAYPTIGDKLVFTLGTYSGNAVYGAELWVTNGTEPGTKILKDINPGKADGASFEFALLGSKLVFQGTEPGAGSELWITDGSADGTLLLKDINTGTGNSSPNGFVTLGDKVIFSATENAHGTEVWITDGTPEGTILLADIIPGAAGSELRHFRRGNNLVYFSAFDTEKGWTLWRTNGTVEGTQMVIDVIPGKTKQEYTNNLGVAGDKFYFSANDGVHGEELWVTDGTQLGTHIIDIVPGAKSSIPYYVVDINGVAYFKADASLWRTNGTVSGTFKVSALEPFSMALYNNWVYFTAFHQDYGVELFKVEFTKLDQEIVFDPILDKRFEDAPFQITASASSGLPVVVSSSNELIISQNTATIVKPGSVAIMIRQDGDALFNAAQVDYTFCIVPAKPTITVSGLNTGKPVLTSSAAEGNQWFGDNIEIPGATEKTFEPEESNAFKVRVVMDGCTSVFSDEEVILITGVEDAEDLVIFYPNPASAHLMIQATGHAGDIQVDILDVQGRPIEGFYILSNTPAVHSLQGYGPGIYLIKIITNRGTSYHRFVKK